ncbi:MAG: hypothetical protein FJ286_09010 [Planctomycetes bacterium]|nr:hypothetical protein [Planctomycetota bacterium]
MRVRPVLALACLIVGSAAGWTVVPLRAESPETGRGDRAGLEDRLTSGLRVKAPREVKFVQNVVRNVREGRLPEHLVDATYLWAVRRGKKYPFPAFEHVMRLKAEKLGVDLDALSGP